MGKRRRRSSKSKGKKNEVNFEPEEETKEAEEESKEAESLPKPVPMLRGEWTSRLHFSHLSLPRWMLSHSSSRSQLLKSPLGSFGSPRSPGSPGSARSRDSVLTNYSETSFVNGENSPVRQYGWFHVGTRDPLAVHSYTRIRLFTHDLAPDRDTPWRSLYTLLPLKESQRQMWATKLLPRVEDAQSLDMGKRSLLWHAVRIGDEFAVRELLVRGHGDLITQRDQFLNLDVSHIAILFDESRSAEDARRRTRFDSVFKWEFKAAANETKDAKRKRNKNKFSSSRGLSCIRFTSTVRADDSQHSKSTAEVGTAAVGTADFSPPPESSIRGNAEVQFSEQFSEQGKERKNEESFLEFKQRIISEKRACIRRMIYVEVCRQIKERKKHMFGRNLADWQLCRRRLKGLSKNVTHKWLLGPTNNMAWYELFKMMPLVDTELNVVSFNKLMKEIDEEINYPDLNGATILWHAARIENNDAAMRWLSANPHILKIVRKRDALFHLEPHDVAALHGNTRTALMIEHLITRAKTIGLGRPIHKRA